MAVVIEAVYQGELRCRAAHGPSGATLETEAPEDNGGLGRSFSPTDLVATALGTCVLTIMAQVAERHDVRLDGTTVRVEKQMIARPVRRIGSLRTIVTVPAGVCPDGAMRKRLVAAANKCPVHQSLHDDIDAPIEVVWT